MFLALATVIAIVLWNNADAKMPPVEGTCSEKFIEVYPPDVMFTGKVMKHTDDFNPPLPDCLTMKMARRASFNSNFRLELSSTVVNTETEIRNNVPLLMVDVAVKAHSPLAMNIGDESATPPTLMITHFDKESECYTAWACIDMNGSVQKLGWVVCKENDVDPSLVEQLLEDLSKEAEISKEHFVDTQIDLC